MLVSYHLQGLSLYFRNLSRTFCLYLVETYLDMVVLSRMKLNEDLDGFLTIQQDPWLHKKLVLKLTRLLKLEVRDLETGASSLSLQFSQLFRTTC